MHDKCVESVEKHGHRDFKDQLPTPGGGRFAQSSEGAVSPASLNDLLDGIKRRQ